MTLQLHSPWWALAAIALVAAAILAWKQRPPTLRVSSIDLFARAARAGRFSWAARLPLLLYLLGGLLLIAALMRPQSGLEHIVERREGVDIILALDVSGSMMEYDVPDEFSTDRQIRDALNEGILRSRIDIAKAELRHFVEARPEDRIGLIAFARFAYMVCPPTLDHRFLIRSLERLEAGEFADGTGIAAPITTAVDRLKDAESPRRVLVLFSDGENNVRAPVGPRQAARIAETFHVTIHTVGIGSERSVMIRHTPYGQLVRAGSGGFDDALLKSLSDITGGHYFEAGSADGFAAVMHEIDDIEAAVIEQDVLIDYHERFLPLLLGATALLLLAFLLENTFSQTLP